MRGLGVDAVASLSEFATGGLVPDLVVLFDIDDATAAQRRSPTADRMEREGDAFHAAVRQAYRDLASRFGWTTVDGAGPPDTVAARVRDAVQPLLGS